MSDVVKHINKRLESLDQFDDQLKSLTGVLNEEIWGTAREQKIVLVRSVHIRQCPNRFRIEWCRLKHIKSDSFAKSKVYFSRIKLNNCSSKKTFKQSQTLMGKLDEFHLGIFNEYDKKFAAIREMAEANGDYREGLKKMKRIFENIEF
ncbi:hypothetical protein [Stutzerimonas kunmingensis]|uniref:hypothetical protein n=1 Tax=Stutzerimonas kunmingensis TaxID=1211807 RepID=UPI001F16CDD6|nr:hypothetical protein [Stutzerimonas kunmingensis]UIP31118.1 hypothetical protein LW136_13250 [Stutzerimonas kunmingensis]